MALTQRPRWRLPHAIYIVKSALADGLSTHERLKRVYKRLIDLAKANEAVDESATTKP